MNKFLITALILVNLTVLSAQESSKALVVNKNSNKSIERRKGIELWNCSEINTERTEFAPAFYQYGLVYASSEKNGRIDPQSGEPFFQLFYSETDRNNIPMKPHLYSLEANSQYHEGGVSFSKKWDAMYFSSSNQSSGFSIADNKGVSRMKIYESKRGLRDWEKSVELPFNNNKFSCFHPSLSTDGRTLYFASDMPGGKGGFDIYKVENTGKGWSKPINLGSAINTDSDEAFPFIHDSGTLFFSSKGHSSTGGFDIFKVDLNKTAPAIINLGEPFSSAADDLGLILNTDGNVGYFCSNREGGFGKDDIYMYKTEFKLTAEAQPLKALITVKDAATSKQIGGAEIRIFEKSGDRFLAGEEFYDVKMTTNANGKDMAIETVRKAVEKLGKPNCYSASSGDVQYELKNDQEYLILVNKESYETKELNYNTFNKEAGFAILEILLDKAKKPSLKAVVISDKFNTAIPNASISITNNTTQKSETLYTNSSGEFDFVPEINTNYNIRIEKSGYKSTIETLSVDKDVSKAIDKKFILIPIEPEVVTKPISKGAVIILEKIYYDFDKAIIRVGAASELDALSDLMNKYKSMEVELVSHTDSRGNAAYNQRLSDQRAISAKNYLIAKGIAENRISARGAGETQLRNKCVDGIKCSELEHQYNRRTEVTITKINEPAVKVEYGDRGPEVIHGKDN
ncbi:MAG: OmpA family protein [Saprospiraceae bacterium]